MTFSELERTTKNLKKPQNSYIIYIESEREVTSQSKCNWRPPPQSGRKKDKVNRIDAYRAVVANEVTEEVIAKFEELIVAYEAEGEKRRNRAAEKRAEKLEAEKFLEDGILEVLGDTPMTASDLKEAVEGLNTPQKATVVAKRLVAAGKVKVEDVKGKNGKVKGYSLV